MQGIFEVKREQFAYIINGCSVAAIHISPASKDKPPSLTFNGLGDNDSLTLTAGEPGLVGIVYICNRSGKGFEHADDRINEIVQGFNTKHQGARREGK